MLVGEKPNTTIINTGSRLVSKGNSKYKIKMQDSSILGRINNDLNMVMKQVNFSLRNLCKAYGFAFICYENIDRYRSWRDGIPLTNEGTSLLPKKITEYLNSFFHQDMD